MKLLRNFIYVDDQITSINYLQGSISLWIVWIIAGSQRINKLKKIVSAQECLKIKIWINFKCKSTWHLALAFWND
jgi:hypothetical protein